MNRILMIYVMMLSMFFLYFLSYQREQEYIELVNDSMSCMKGEISEKYVMVTFQSGMEYWKRTYKGFEDAAQLLNVSVEYFGATQRDSYEQVTILEQLIAKKPSGIALSAIEPKALNKVIEKANLAKIPIVLFDSGIPHCGKVTYLGTNNFEAGVLAAHEMATLLDAKGKVVIISSPNQLNMEQRLKGFEETLEKSYPFIEIIKVLDGKGNEMESQLLTNRIISENPDIKGIFVTEAISTAGVGYAIKKLGRTSNIKIIGFDTDRSTLEMINDGVITMTIAQNTWNMGYWSLFHLFHLQHDPANVLNNWSPDRHFIHIPVNMDTGISIVTKENIHLYYP